MWGSLVRAQAGPQNKNIMKIAVTGGCGFIGSSFVNYLINVKGFDKKNLLVIDKLTYASNRNLIDLDIPFLKKDICDVTLEDVFDANYIVNFAAESHVDKSIENGLPFIKTNVEGTFNLLEVARKIKGFKKFVQISTDEVYGDMDTQKMTSATEESKIHPSSYYSATKASSDHLVLSAGRTYGLPILITRTCNNFGRNQHQEKFLPTVYRSIKSEIPVPIYGDGEQIREWIWVEDNVKLVYDLMISEIGIWNIGSGDEWSNKEIINEISKIIGKPVNFKYVEDRPGHDRRYSLNTTKLELKMKNSVLTEKSLKKYLKELYS